MCSDDLPNYTTKIGILSATNASNCYPKGLVMDQRRLRAKFVQLGIYWWQIITANLGIIAVEPAVIYTL